MRSKLTALTFKKVESGKYFCPELGIIIERERIGGAYGPARTEWSMATEHSSVATQSLGEAKEFLTEIYNRAHEKAATGRTKAQAKLTRVNAKRWRTADGITVWSESRGHSMAGHLVNRFVVELSPGDISSRAVVGTTLDEARRFIERISWRGGKDK